MEFKETYKNWQEYKLRAENAWARYSSANAEIRRLQAEAAGLEDEARYCQEEAQDFKKMLDAALTSGDVEE